MTWPRVLRFLTTVPTSVYHTTTSEYVTSFLVCGTRVGPVSRPEQLVPLIPAGVDRPDKLVVLWLSRAKEHVVSNLRFVYTVYVEQAHGRIIWHIHGRCSVANRDLIIVPNTHVVVGGLDQPRVAPRKEFVLDSAGRRVRAWFLARDSGRDSDSMLYYAFV